ncbi:hypothetical protein O7605_04080 [Verrucosispora sp. WMMA2121]|uniref:hypothetical protein n=1 Tax=Verrucosispora sp. WMMA2121 TaxID=3015164 RepID=UPI0022B66953|nr:MULTISPECIES: hypothetical protein [unclassified Micromonospora]MCZ7418695.1 hypothetical protein [Verrucosispora sp. WMMA2121]WBB92397.1 hypothetical protein O7597_05150 [Verrucosispora sp. WMMC514]
MLVAGALAGITGATTGLTFVIAPIAGTALYEFGSAMPIVAGTVIMAAVVTVFVHPHFRRIPPPASGLPPA